MVSRSGLAASAVLAAFGSVASAQRFVADRIEHVPGELPFPVAALAAGDLDADSDLDAVALGVTDGVLLLRNSGGRFGVEDLALLPGVAPRSSPCLRDVDGDGATDLLGLGPGGVVLLRGDGRGRLLATPGLIGPSLPGSGGQVHPLDLDGDGRQELLVSRGAVQLWRFDPATGRYVNDSARAFGGQTHTGVHALTVGDLDGDGRGDVALLGSARTTLLFARPDPAGGDRLVTDQAASSPPAGGLTIRDVVAADVDGDQRIDLVAVTDGGTRVLLQTSALTFAMQVLPGADALDRLAVSASGEIFGTDSSGRTRAWQKVPSGPFVELFVLPPRVPTQLAAADVGWILADFDSVRGADLMSTAGGRIDLWAADSRINQDRFTVVAGPVAAPDWPLRPHAAVDVDADGDVDLVGAWTPRGQTASLVLARNDGRGRYRYEPLAAGRLAGRLAPADVDGDGDVDLFGAVGGAVGVPNALPDLLLINDGFGRFTEESALRMPAQSIGTNLLLPGDIDGDGDVDAVLIGTQPTAYLNDGRGHFTLAPPGAFPGVTGIITFGALADVDGDGDLDVLRVLDDPFFASQSLLLNDGAGTFTFAPRGSLPPAGRVSRVAVADVDADGALDVVYGGVAGGDSWLRGDGQGRFARQPALPPALDASRTATAELRVADLDEDGALDVLLWRQPLGGAGRASLRYLRGDGAGGFVVANVAGSGEFVGAGGSLRAVVADLDGDRDLDVFGDRGRWRNRGRDLHLPVRAELAAEFGVELRAAPGTGVALWWSPAGMAAPRALGSLGFLRLDPASSLPWRSGLLTVPASGVSRDFAVTVPSDPRLIGWSFALQAGFVPSVGGDASLSAVAPAVVWR